MALLVKLEVFEGPLDLLLHLIEKNKVDIYDIPIVEITEQYLDYVKLMIRQNDEYIFACEQMHRKKTVEFAILWFFSLLIIAVLRFALSEFYMSLIDKGFFKIYAFGKL